MPESELKEKLQVYTQDVLEEMMEAILASKPLKRPEYSPEYSDLDVPDKYREMTLTQLMEADHIHSYIAVTMQPNDWDEALTWFLKKPPQGHPILKVPKRLYQRIGSGSNGDTNLVPANYRVLLVFSKPQKRIMEIAKINPKSESAPKIESGS